MSLPGSLWIPAVMTKRSSRSLWGSQLDPKISEPWDLYAMNFRTMGPEWSFLIRGRNLRVSGRKQISPWLEMGKSYIINNYTLERIRGRIWTWHFLGCWRLAKTIWPTWRLQTGKKQSNHEWARNQRTQNLKGLLCLCWWNTAMGATQPRNSQRWKPFGPVHMYMPRLTERVTPPISPAKCGHFPSSSLTAKSTLIGVLSLRR